MNGIRLWDANANLVFDSTLATGGICLGFFTVAAGGSTFTFPSITGAAGFALVAGAGGIAASDYYTTDSALGYLRFTFYPVVSGTVFVLFAK